MSWKENRAWLRKSNFKKLLNAWRIYRSFHKSKKKGIPKMNGLPISLSFEPTTACNLRCPECPSGLRSFTRPTGHAEIDLFKKLIDQTKSHLIWLTLYFQGEPFLHPDFLKMVNYAHSNNIHVATSTNAHYITADNAKEIVNSGLDKLIISIDGTTQDTYEQYRVGGQISKVIEGTKHIVEAKKELKSRYPLVIFQFLVVKPNEHQVEETQKLAQDIGVDGINFKTAQIYDYKNGSSLIPDNPKYARYKLNEDGTYSIKNKLDNQCWRMWQSAVVTWDGKMVPCCFDKDAKYNMGNIAELSLSNIWFSDVYNNFRSKLLTGRKEIDICANCSEGTKVFEQD